MSDKIMIDLLCREWAFRCEDIDRAISKGNSETAFFEADEFRGWMCGFRDACFAMRLHDAAKTTHQANQLFTYRRNQQLFCKWNPDAAING